MKFRVAFLSMLITPAFMLPLHAQRTDSSSPAQPEGSSPVAALTPEEQTVLRPLQLMCDGLMKKDVKLIQEQLLPGGMVTQARDGKAVQMHFDAFTARLKQLLESSSDQIDETLYHPLVHIDHDIAVVWAPYVAHLNGKTDHCGTNIVTMFRLNDRWLISNIADTGRRQDCSAD